jgi:membrane-associated protease RseP (regulator of RpoE activity)
MLFRRTTVELLLRLVTFRSVDGWGGAVAFVLTAGRAAAVSCMAWHSMIGVMFLSLGVFNLLPVPGSNGFSSPTLQVMAERSRNL